MNDNRKNKKSNGQKNKKSDTPHEFEMFALAGGKRNPESGTTIPYKEGVEAAKAFVDENHK